MQPFDAVVAEHGTTVLRVCRAVLPIADADDAWGDTFLAALEAYEALDEGADVRGWLVTIAHRKAIDIWRRRSRETLVAEHPERAAADPGFDLDLRRGLESLSERQRTAVVLHHLGGVPFAEVAAQLDCSPAAARRASADGIAALRQLMAPAGERATDGGIA